jgi:hypothetical protein
MQANTISPQYLSDIFGAGQIGDPLIHLLEFGDSGDYELGTVVSLTADGKVVKTIGGGGTGDNTAQVYGVIAQERMIADIDTERFPAAHVIRRASLKAELLVVHDSTSLSEIAERMRSIGLYLEGLAGSVAPPFRIKLLTPTVAETNQTNVRIDVWVDGSMEDTARLWFDGGKLPTSIRPDFSHIFATIPTMGAAERVVKIQVRQGAWRSQEVNFAIKPAVTTPPPPAPLPPRRQRP